MSRRIPPLVLVLTALACGGPRESGAPSPASPSPGPPPGPSVDLDAPLPSRLPDVVARVNGQPILARQVVPYARRRLEPQGDEERERNRPRALRQALREYIDRELLFQEALARGLRADDRAVQGAYDRARVEQKEEKAWVDFLAARGFDPQSYRTEIRVQATVNVLLRRAAEETTVAEDEARGRYEAAPEEFPPPEGRPAGFDSVREQVEARLLEEKRRSAGDVLLRRLRARARIETYI